MNLLDKKFEFDIKNNSFDILRTLNKGETLSSRGKAEGSCSDHDKTLHFLQDEPVELSNSLVLFYRKKDKYLGVQIKDTKQKIVAIVIILFMFLMIAASLEIKQAVFAANTDTTNLYQNITAGTLDMEAVGTVVFNDMAAGSPDNSLANLTVVNVRDYRGSSAGWSTTAVCTNFTNGAGGTVIIPNSRLRIDCGDQFAYNGASNTGVAKCSYTGNFLDGARTIINAAAAFGQGAYNLYNNTLNLMILAADQTLNYNATMTFTVT